MAQSENWKNLILQYPGLIVTGSNAKGTVKIQGKWFRVKILCPNFPQLQDAIIELLQTHQNKFITILNTNLQSGWTLYDAMENIPQLLQKQCEKISTFSCRSEDTLPENIYQEIVAIYSPESYQLQLNDACSRLRFCKFALHGKHYLQVELPSLRISEHSLPDCFDWEEQLHKYNNLAAMVQQFQKYLEDLQPFYDNFTDIDELCYVVQPSPPVSTKHNWRLFVLRERVYLKLVIVDPFAPIASMSLQVIGPTQAVEELRRTLSDGLREWDAELDIHKNLLRIFDLCYFPMPPGSGWLGGEHEATAAEQFCNICYSYQLDQGEIPIVSCDNPHCTLIYHASCLKEWFNTLTDGKNFLSVSFGACPFCKTKLSTSFAELLEN
ncbi:E3 ubiquitin-protein ligase FANCL [Rhagoletis pomonella]|uniref:E3 ubiquitin-protein ligase FANCL n=1 Tax=Rhagoletis pomonella TaxID=28610 RepID=UPI00177B3477|nr:E3 ubiquitin-protein ligase FANCL [Rhagoletis pomonella]XP_036324360.1 E3 ubiquitin-protein ligase FANCL [Rhagoletis pomonella]XP_036324361.1 E3 ubiquitin-protein ligase FANCL [Rhagoletis pomonella]